MNAFFSHLIFIFITSFLPFFALNGFSYNEIDNTSTLIAGHGGGSGHHGRGGSGHHGGRSHHRSHHSSKGHSRSSHHGNALYGHKGQGSQHTQHFDKQGTSGKMHDTSGPQVHHGTPSIQHSGTQTFKNMSSTSNMTGEKPTTDQGHHEGEKWKHDGGKWGGGGGGSTVIEVPGGGGFEGIGGYNAIPIQADPESSYEDVYYNTAASPSPAPPPPPPDKKKTDDNQPSDNPSPMPSPTDDMPPPHKHKHHHHEDTFGIGGIKKVFKQECERLKVEYANNLAQLRHWEYVLRQDNGRRSWLEGKLANMLLTRPGKGDTPSSEEAEVSNELAQINGKIKEDQAKVSELQPEVDRLRSLSADCK